MKISIVTAVYNNKDLIKSAINSVCSQKDVDIEYIIMDGGSTDGTLDYIKQMNVKDLILESGKDKGIYDALNKGIAKSSGEIVGILHSDDIYYSNESLKKVEKAFSDGADVVYGDLEYVQREDVSKIFRKWKSGFFTDLDLRLGWIAPHPSFFVRKSVYNEIGDFDLNYKISGDYDFILRALTNKKFKVTYIPETIVKMRVGGESNKTLKNKFKGNLEDYEIAKKYFSTPAFTVFSKVFRKIPQLFLK